MMSIVDAWIKEAFELTSRIYLGMTSSLLKLLQLVPCFLSLVKGLKSIGLVKYISLLDTTSLSRCFLQQQQYVQKVWMTYGVPCSNVRLDFLLLVDVRWERYLLCAFDTVVCVFVNHILSIITASRNPGIRWRITIVYECAALVGVMYTISCPAIEGMA